MDQRPFWINGLCYIVSSGAPVLMTFKVLNSNDRRLLKSWIKLLIILLLITNLEKILVSPCSEEEILVTFAKLWLFNPYTQGYIIIFNQFIQPLIVSKETVIKKENDNHNTNQKYFNVIFEDFFEKLLRLNHQFMLKFLNMLFGFNNNRLLFHQRIFRNSLPLFHHFFHGYFNELSSITKDIKSLEKKYEKREKSYPKSIEKIHHNLYVEYLISRYKERSNFSSFFNTCLSIIGLLFNLIINLFWLIYYKFTKRIVHNDIPNKKVKFQSSNDKLIVPKIPVIQLTPASPEINEIKPIPKTNILRRQHSKSVGSLSGPNSIIGELSKETPTERHRRNSFKGFLKNSNRNSFTTLSKLVNNSRDNSLDITRDSNEVRSRSNSANKSTANHGNTSKVSTIDETSFKDEGKSISVNDLFVKSFSDITTLKKSAKKVLSPDAFGFPVLMPLKASSNVSLVQDTSELKDDNENLEPIMASPVSLESGSNPELPSLLVADPFSAIFKNSEINSSKERSNSPESKNSSEVKRNRRSFMLFKKPHNDSPSIDYSLSKKKEDSKKSSIDIPRISRWSLDRNKKINKEAYDQLNGNVSTTTTDISIDSDKSLENKNTATTESIENLHTRQDSSTTSIGIKFVHTFTPDLRKISQFNNDSELETKVTHSNTIDYLTYEHGSENYHRSPLYKREKSFENVMEENRRDSIIKRNSLKNKFKLLSKKGSPEKKLFALKRQSI